MAPAVLGHQFLHPDAPLAREEDRWQWLSGITGRYMYQRAVTLWMGKNQALDVDDSYQYPWDSRPLSMSERSARTGALETGSLGAGAHKGNPEAQQPPDPRPPRHPRPHQHRHRHTPTSTHSTKSAAPQPAPLPKKQKKAKQASGKRGARERQGKRLRGELKANIQARGPGHRARKATHRASAPVNRSQVAQDTAHATQHTERAHQ